MTKRPAAAEHGAPGQQAQTGPAARAITDELASVPGLSTALDGEPAVPGRLSAAR